MGLHSLLPFNGFQSTDKSWAITCITSLDRLIESLYWLWMRLSILAVSFSASLRSTISCIFYHCIKTFLGRPRQRDGPYNRCVTWCNLKWVTFLSNILSQPNPNHNRNNLDGPKIDSLSILVWIASRKHLLFPLHYVHVAMTRPMVVHTVYVKIVLV